MRRGLYPSLLWVLSCLPLAMGVVIMGAGMRMICQFENEDHIPGNATVGTTEEVPFSG